jgi:hypothetical protein
VVARLLSADQKPADTVACKPTGVFARVVSRKHVTLKDGRAPVGFLGVRPFVFVTLPEALDGRSLLDVFSAIGYGADDVLAGQLGEEKVALVFRWNDPTVLHPGRAGELPEQWQTAVYPATWDNLFALVERMAGDKDWHSVGAKGGPPDFTRVGFASDRERSFVSGFSEAGKARVRAASYHALRETRGADWEYRDFLGRALGASEHFTGDGATKPTFAAGGKPAGFPEYLGPNRPLAEIKELAVIGLGAVRIEAIPAR